MTKEPKKSESAEQSILSGPEVVGKFLDSLANDASLDSATVSAIRQLYQGNKLTHTNLLSKLEAERKVSEG